VVICLEQGADLNMAQLMPLSLTVSCFSKIQTGFTFLVPAYPGSPGHWAIKRVYVCMYIISLAFPTHMVDSTHTQCGDSVDNTVEENSSVFSPIRVCWFSLVILQYAKYFWFSG